LAWAALAVFGPVAAFRVTLLAIPESKLKPDWVASSGEPPPRDFLYAMFPVNSGVPLRDAPDGKPVSVLGRAVVNSQEEVDAGGWIGVLGGSDPAWVALSDLSCLPPADASTDYFGSFVSAYQSRDPSDYRNARLNFRRERSGTTTATLRISQDDHWQAYVYQVSSGPPKPLEMYRVFGPGEVFKNLDRNLAATGAAAVFLIGVGALRRRAVRTGAGPSAL